MSNLKISINKSVETQEPIIVYEQEYHSPYEKLQISIDFRNIKTKIIKNRRNKCQTLNH
jgi:hypothetical protein